MLILYAQNLLALPYFQRMSKSQINIVLLLISIVLFTGNYFKYDDYLGIIILLIYLFNYFYGVFEIRNDFFFKSVHKVASDKVILTFDDGPNDMTLNVAKTLKEKNAGGVFFLLGENMAVAKEIVDMLAADGFVLGNHTYTHSKFLSLYSPSKICDEMLSTEELLGPNSCKIFRPPYGITSSRIKVAAKRMGLKSIGWSVRSLDTVISSQDKLTTRIIDQTTSGSIILLHEKGKVTSESLGLIIDELRKSGKEIATNKEIRELLS